MRSRRAESLPSAVIWVKKEEDELLLFFPGNSPSSFAYTQLEKKYSLSRGVASLPLAIASLEELGRLTLFG